VAVIAILQTEKVKFCVSFEWFSQNVEARCLYLKAYYRLSTFLTVLMNRKNQEHGYMVDACAESITLPSLVRDGIGRFGIASTIERRLKSSESVHK
jgi:hypothetical protein